MKKPATHQAMKAAPMKRPASQSASRTKVYNARHYKKVTKPKRERQQAKALKNVRHRARKAATADVEYEPRDAKVKLIAKVAYDAQLQAKAAQKIAEENAAKVNTVAGKVDAVEVTANRALRVALHNRKRLDVIDDKSGYKTPPRSG